MWVGGGSGLFNEMKILKSWIENHDDDGLGWVFGCENDSPYDVVENDEVEAIFDVEVVIRVAAIQAHRRRGEVVEVVVEVLLLLRRRHHRLLLSGLL